MPDIRKGEPPAVTFDASRSAEKSRVEPTLPLGGGAFASPLVPTSSPNSNSAAKRNYLLTAAMLLGGAVLGAGMISAALLVSRQRGSAAEHERAEPRVELRAETPAERRMASAPLRTERRPLAALAPSRSAPSTSAPSAAAPATTSAIGATAMGASSAQPTATVQAMPVASSKRQRASDATRAERKPQITPPEPALPEALTRAQVIAAMRKITPAVNACFGSSHGKADVAFSVIGKTGRVVGARVTGKTGKVGSCIARSVRRARFPKFAKARIEISYPFAR